MTARGSPPGRLERSASVKALEPLTNLDGERVRRRDEATKDAASHERSGGAKLMRRFSTMLPSRSSPSTSS